MNTEQQWWRIARPHQMITPQSFFVHFFRLFLCFIQKIYCLEYRLNFSQFYWMVYTNKWHDKAQPHGCVSIIATNFSLHFFYLLHRVIFIYISLKWLHFGGTNSFRYYWYHYLVQNRIWQALPAQCMEFVHMTDCVTYKSMINEIRFEC